MNRETAKRLLDVSAACGEVIAYCDGVARDAFLVDRTLQLVVAHLTMIIGEAMHRADRSDPSLIDSIPNLRDIVDTRNRVIHGYDDVNYALLWDIAQDDVPDLKVTIDALLHEFERADPPVDTR